MRRSIPVDRVNRAKVPAHTHLIVLLVEAVYRVSRRVCVSTLILTSTCRARHVKELFLGVSKIEAESTKGENSSFDRGKSFFFILFLAQLLLFITMP